MEKLTSRKNPIVRHFRLLGSEREYRMQTGEFLCDGQKMLEEAIQFGATITAVIRKGPANAGSLSCPEFGASPELYDYVSPLKNSPGPLFSVKIPEPKLCGFHNALVLADVQDPGNVGTAIRTANAFGIDAVILTGNCADLYNPKTVRATMGAIFRQRVFRTDTGELQTLLRSNGLKLYGAALHRTSVDVRSISLADTAVAIGSEGKGLSEEMLKLCDGLVVIPMMPESESLNAAQAATVLMWEMARGGLQP